MKILIIEDEKELADSISAYLEEGGYKCEVAPNFVIGDEKIHLSNYDCVLLDITLPGGSGIDILHHLKKTKPDAAVIIISAKNSLDDVVTGLDLGADDYLAKPFHLSELNARLKSIIRRRNFSGNNEIVFNEIIAIPANWEMTVNGKFVELTKKEYELLLYFLANIDRMVTRESIAEHLWGEEVDRFDSFEVIYSHIKNLRKKILEKGGNDYIKTVYGMGYKFTKK
ncbi:MAG TPA: response regulator transcription factor [Bacteroidia bacterium]|nr:response regulator transcription factor [Bacteroidia bacterium]